MSNEIRVQTSLSVRNGSLDYQSRPTTFNADMTGDAGPTPGMVLCSTNGTDISFSQLTSMGGVCRIQNLDENHHVEVGIYEPDTNRFFPMLEVLPGESYVVRLSRYLSQNFVGTGTSVDDSDQTLRIKGVLGACNVLVEAFDR